MMSSIPKGGSVQWYIYYSEQVKKLGDELGLPETVITNARMLWAALGGKVARSPLPLVVDCVYICAKLSGHRASIKQIKRASKTIWDKAIEVLPPNRHPGGQRWIWSQKALILSVYPDEAAWEDFVSAWQDQVVDQAYFDEGD